MRLRRLPSVPQLFLDIGNAFFIALVKGPLLDALGSKDTDLDEDSQMLAGSRLSNAKFLGDKQAADPIFNKVTVDLRGKMRARILQPTHDLQPTLIGKRFQDRRRQ